MKLVSFLLTIFLSFSASATSPFTNILDIQKQLGFQRYYTSEGAKRPLRVAILDKGFDGYQAEIGVTLPAKTVYVPGPIATPAEIKIEHGLKMAQILTALMTNEMNSPQWQPELTLYNVFGFTNFQSAVADLIAKKVDLVLYSEVWEYGGNYDGKGFINAEVSRATKAGIVWVNAAGNFALTTYNTSIHTGTDNWVVLPDQNKGLAITCEKSKDGKETKCPVKIVLSWNDFKNDVEAGTEKDLDLALVDDLLNVVEVGGLKQSSDRKEARPGYSKYPREIISAELKPGLYFIRVKNRSNNFTADDRLRITVDGEVKMPSHSKEETLLNPGDNASVITVGASDSDRSSASVLLNKPDLMAPSSLKLTDGEEFRGSSNSAAIVAAGLALLKSREPRLSRADLLRYSRVTNANGSWDQGGLSLNQLYFTPTGSNCFNQAQIAQVPDYLKDVLARGGVLVDTTLAARVMVPFDPAILAPQLVRTFANDMIVATPSEGYQIYRRNAYVPSGSVEIFQRPIEAGLCQPPSIRPSKSFMMP